MLCNYVMRKRPDTTLRNIIDNPNKGQLVGLNSPTWSGGITIDRKGYVWVKRPEHHFARKDGYVTYHRIVYESFHKCSLLPWVDIHHIDKNKRNNFPNNLEPILHDKHTSLTITGNKWSEESKRRQSESRKGEKLWWMFGKERSPETKIKISLAHKGKKLSPETIQKISLSKKGSIPWNKGKKKND